MRPLALLIAVSLLAGCKKEPPEPTPQEQAEGFYLRATNESLLGNHDAALAAYDEVRKRVPHDPRLPAAIGEVYILQGRWPEARLQFQEAVRLEPKRATNWSRLAAVQAMQKDKDAARQSLEKALALNPTDFNALEQLAEFAQQELAQDAPEPLVSEVAALWRRAALAAPDYRQGELYLQGYRLLQAAGQQPQAEQFLVEAADAGTRAPEIYATLGELRIRSNGFASAIWAFEKAAELTPVSKLPDGGVTGDSTYWEILGRLYTRVDQLEKAQAAYQRALALEDRAVVHVALARLAFLRGDEQGTGAELNRALATATGEEIRETLELAELLVEVGRKQDALMLLESHATAEDGARDVELQLRTARLAQQLKKAEIVQAACAQARKLDAGVIGCP
ncbi:MAG: tetratricopeptide repeat protein [Myxococcota bacterium]|nr:tetratricopeptide repeat protein [Myxococcota bacterium]